MKEDNELQVNLDLLLDQWQRTNVVLQDIACELKLNENLEVARCQK